MRARFIASLTLLGGLVAAACSPASRVAGGVEEDPGSGTSDPGAGGTGSGTAGGGGGASTGTGSGTGTGTGTSTGTTTGTGTGTGTGTMCAPGKGDCNGDAADGCETDLATDASHCGACGTKCPDGGGVSGACVGGACGLACAKGQGDCDKNPANGCETNLDADAAHCGACGNDCGGAPCVAGACACAAETQKADLVQLDLFVMLDQSGSMQDAVQSGGTKWDAVTSALKAFVADPANASLGVGLQFFGVPPSSPPPLSCKSDADCNGYGPCLPFIGCAGAFGGAPDSCDGKDYAKAAVEIALLDAKQVGSLTSSIDGHSPQGASTPTAPAIQGAVMHAVQWEQAHPGHGVVVVLATDGDPTGCGNQDPVGAAKAGLAGPPSVKTFVIGVGNSLQSLNAIAAAGGTQSAFLVDTNQANVIQQLQAALAAIQKAALGCEYAIPQPKMGKLDFAKVNVQYTPGGGGAVQALKNVKDKASCDPQTGGWYYDDNAKPTKILLCDATCGVVQADAKAQVDVLLGCATVHQ